MRLVRPALALVFGLATLYSLAAQQATPRPVAALRRDAAGLLKRAEAASAGSVAAKQAFNEAADLLEQIPARTPSADDQKAVRDASAALRARARGDSAPPFSAAPLVALLDRIEIQDTPTPGPGLEFQGSYTHSTPKEPAYGGHASAMGPPPTEAPHPTVTSPVTFDEIRCISAKTYCGGRTKDHILESGGRVELRTAAWRSTITSRRSPWIPATRLPTWSSRMLPSTSSI
jgi:hypothetical protein